MRSRHSDPALPFPTAADVWATDCLLVLHYETWTSPNKSHDFVHT